MRSGSVCGGVSRLHGFIGLGRGWGISGCRKCGQLGDVFERKCIRFWAPLFTLHTDMCACAHTRPNSMLMLCKFMGVVGDVNPNSTLMLCRFMGVVGDVNPSYMMMLYR